MVGEVASRLVIVSRSLPPDVGGYQRQFQLLAPHLAAQLGPILWIGAVRDDPRGRQPPAAGPRRMEVAAYRIPRRLRGGADVAVVVLVLCLLVLLRLRGRPPGVLLLLSPTMVGGAVLVRAAGSLGWRTSARFPTSGDQSHRRGRSVGRLINGVNLVPSPSQSGEQAEYPVAVLLNAVEPRDDDVTRPRREDEGTFLFLGRLVGRKRPGLALRAWGEIADELPGWRMVIAGGGGEERDSVELELRRWAADHDLPRCDFVGEVNDPAAILRDTDVLVFPSLREGLPNVVLEALASRLPVIADPALAAEWFGRPVPLLSWDGAEETLAGSMLDAARSPAERKRVAAAGAGFVAEHHAPARIATDLVRMVLRDPATAHADTDMVG